MQSAKKGKESTMDQFPFFQCTPFTPLQQIQLLPHCDPNLQFGITLKFAATATEQDPLLLLLECQVEEIYTQLQSTLNSLLLESKAIQFESSSSIAAKIEQTLDLANNEPLSEAKPTYLVHHPQRALFIEQSKPFLADEQALKSELDCILHVLDTTEGRWKSKGPTLISFQADEEQFVFVTFCMHQTFRPIQTPIWLHNIKKIDQFIRFRALIQTAQGDRLLCKFASAEQIGAFMGSLACLRGDNKESCFYSNAVAASAKSLAENWTMSKLKYCAYPVLLYLQTQSENLQVQGILSVNEANCMIFESYDGSFKREIQLDLSLRHSFNNAYISQRHLFVQLVEGEELVFCFGGPSATEAKAELVRLYKGEVVQQLESEEKLQHLLLL